VSLRDAGYRHSRRFDLVTASSPRLVNQTAPRRLRVTCEKPLGNRRFIGSWRGLVRTTHFGGSVSSMQINLDPEGRKVVIFGDAAGARQVLRRFISSGATVTLATSGPLPAVSDWMSTVRYATQPELTDTAGLLRLIGPAWLIVDVDVPEPLRHRISDLAAQLHILMINEFPAPSSGRVTLVGGGPGRTGLLTLDACEALRRADVILYDRLAPTEDLAELAPGVELIDVGKSPYHHPIPQHSIEQLMITRAQHGESVVRLKGGDSFVFGRGGEEMQACLDAGLPVHVVPGVSSSIAVPAATGIPVTHRGVSRSFTVISGHTPPDPEELEGLVRLGGTIVILMGICNLTQIVAGLCRSGLDPTTPAAAIERGFSDAQRSAMCSVGQLPAEVRRLDICSPAVAVIGDVVAMSPQFAHSAELIEAFGPRSWSYQAHAS
jgi:uroporphyrin-III C-methyltransferase